VKDVPPGNQAKGTNEESILRECSESKQCRDWPAVIYRKQWDHLILETLLRFWIVSAVTSCTILQLEAPGYTRITVTLDWLVFNLQVANILIVCTSRSKMASLIFAGLQNRKTGIEFRRGVNTVYASQSLLSLEGDFNLNTHFCCFSFVPSKLTPCKQTFPPRHCLEQS
jgi:hypothetical protein